MSDSIAIVTGAPGWLGSRLVKALTTGLETLPDLKDGTKDRVRVASLPGADTAELKATSGRVEIVDCDITDSSQVARLFENTAGATTFHCAGVIHPSAGVKQFFDVNSGGTGNLIKAAEDAGVKRFIHVSSNSPIGCNASRESLFDEHSPYNPYMGYGKSKMEGEELVNSCHQRGRMETVIIRPPWFYGPGQPPRQSLFFTMIKNGKGPIVGGGDNLRSMAYIDNICQGLLLCERTEAANGQTYWIADRRPYTMNEIIDTIESLLENEFQMQVAHKRLRLPGIASDIAYMVDLVVQSLGLYHQKFHVLSEMNKNIACSIEKAEKELGYNPAIELEEGMRRSIKWVLEQGREI